MPGISVGFFSPDAVIGYAGGGDLFAKSVSRVIGRPLPAFPLELRTVEGLAHAYAKVEGHVPLHIDSHGEKASDTKIFNFVFSTAHRPVLLTGNAHGTPGDENRSKILLEIHDKEENAAFGLGALELVPGMFVHFDISAVWHGITAAPVPMRTLGMRQDPTAIIVQIIGYEAEEYEEAISTMTKMLHADRAYWQQAKPDSSRRYNRGEGVGR